MSYLIQNFGYQHYILRVNWKVRALNLIRNYSTIYALLNSHALVLPQNVQTWQFSKLFLTTHNFYFTRFYYALFPKVKEVKHSPIGVNFAKSAQFAALVKLDTLAQLPSSPVLPFRTPLSARLYPYAFGTPLVITPTAKSFYFNLLHRFFHMSLSIWFYVPSSYKFFVHYTYLAPRFRFLTFTNKYYFKVYHV